MLSAKSAILAELKFVRRCPLVLGRRVVSLFAFSTCKGYNDSHLMTPSPLLFCSNHPGLQGNQQNLNNGTGVPFWLFQLCWNPKATRFTGRLFTR
jgi:hypothetical protein